ncbi:hypothetical protein FQA39_LY14965 [Lamprigera yunnana]|nr:hypothetical protein FQA39_LY14965 [Lamprigera yunnana]
MAVEDVATLCEICDEEFSDQCEYYNDENNVPSENDEKSDVKDVLTRERVANKTEVEVNSDDDEEVTSEADTTETLPPTDVYYSSDSTIYKNAHKVFYRLDNPKHFLVYVLKEENQTAVSSTTQDTVKPTE